MGIDPTNLIGQLGNLSSMFDNKQILNQILEQQIKPTVINPATQQAPNPLDGLIAKLAQTINENVDLGKIASAFNITTPEDAIINQLGLTGTNKALVADLLTMINNRGKDDRLFYQPANKDNFFNSVNSIIVNNGDLKVFVDATKLIISKGQNLEKFLDMTATVSQKGDYDDLRRFFNVLNTMVYKGVDLDKYYAFGKDILNKNSYDFESNVFSLQTFVSYGGKIDDFIDIAKNLPTTFLAGRNNLVDLHRIIIDFRNKGGYLPVLFNSLANEARKPDGDVRGYMNTYMKMNGLKDTSPDFNKFDRIERIDGPDMVIKQGESAALFGQAISNVDGLLPESVLYWSSIEDGNLSHGSSYLDLSKLSVGVHHIAVKIGGYWRGGTDTAIKTVIVLPPDAQEENTKVHDDNGHGNDIDGHDESNPGNSAGVDRTQNPVTNPNRFVESDVISIEPPVINVTPPVVDTKGHHDNGHGNDLDGYDESNPGNSAGVDRTQNPVTNTNRFIEDIGKAIESGKAAKIASEPVTFVNVETEQDGGDSVKIVQLVDLTGNLIKQLGAVKKEIDIPDNYYLLMRDALRYNKEYQDKMELQLKEAKNREAQLKTLTDISQFLQTQPGVNNIPQPQP